MCAMYLHILYTNDYGVPNHACDSGPSVSGHFNDSQDIINFITNSIYQAYHVGEELYDDANECQHGHRVQFIIMEIVRYKRIRMNHWWSHSIFIITTEYIMRWCRSSSTFMMVLIGFLSCSFSLCLIQFSKAKNLLQL